MATEVRDWVNDTVLADTVMLAKLYPEVLDLRQGLRPLRRLGRLRGPRLAPTATATPSRWRTATCPWPSSTSKLKPLRRAGEPHHRVHGPLLVQGHARPTRRRTSSPSRTSPSTTSTTATRWVKCPAYDGKPTEAGSMARVFAAYERGVPFISGAGRRPFSASSAPSRATWPPSSPPWAAPPSARSRPSTSPASWRNGSPSSPRPSRAATPSTSASLPAITGEGTGFWEAPRGALYHSEKVESTARSRATRSSSRPRGTWLPSTATASTARSSRRSSAFRWPTSRSPSTPCARFTPSTPAPLAPCTSRSAATGKHFETVTSPWGVK